MTQISTAGADQAALNWLIALRETPQDEAMLDAFDAWLEASDANASAWAAAVRTSGVLGNLAPLVAVEPKVVPFRRRIAVRHLVGTSIAAIAATIVMFVSAPVVMLQLEADYITGIAQREDVRLDDGTVVTLNADSAIAIAYADDARVVRLLKGEAFFAVEPDPDRPFTVEAGDVAATALGTAYEVKLEQAAVAVAVDHGLVSIDGAGPPLAAGEWVEIGARGVADRGSMPPDLVASWRTGLLAVQDRPVADVLDAVRRNFAGQIIVLDGTLLDGRVTGTYNLSNAEEALRAAVQVHGGSVTQLTPFVLVVSRG